MSSRLSTDWRWFSVHFRTTIVMTANDTVEVSKAKHVALIDYVVMIDVA